MSYVVFTSILQKYTELFYRRESRRIFRKYQETWYHAPSLRVANLTNRRINHDLYAFNLYNV